MTTKNEPWKMHDAEDPTEAQVNLDSNPGGYYVKEK